MRFDYARYYELRLVDDVEMVVESCPRELWLKFIHETVIMDSGRGAGM